MRTSVMRGVELAARACGGRHFYRRAYLARGRFAVREERIRVPELPRGLDGLAIAHVSDLHGGPFLTGRDLGDVVRRLEELGADLCAITGDWITHGWRDALPLLARLGEVRPRLGSFAVFGNHDYRGRLEGEIAAAALEHGIRFLRDECARLELGGGALALVGIEDLEESRVLDVARARSAVRPGDVEIVLCHNPLGARRLARAGCVAILSGHTHGGQVDLPLLRRLGPDHPGARIAIGPTTVIVNRGLGVVGFPLRIGARPEIVLVRLERCPARGERAAG